jgi:hypothetical protein
MRGPVTREFRQRTQEKIMRSALAFGIALLITGPAIGAPATPADEPLMLAAAATTGQTGAGMARANVPRTTGTGLTGLPVGGGLILGMDPATAALVGGLVVGGIAAAIILSNDNNNPSNGPGTGSGSGSGSGSGP